MSTTISGRPQLSLGEVLEKVKSFGTKYGTDKKDKTVDFDFGSAVPTTIASWRGSYAECALGYRLSGYDNHDKHFNNMTSEKLIQELQSAIGKTFTGWKGGDFKMNYDTPLWVSNPGNSGDTCIVDVIDKGWRIVLITEWCEY